MDPLGGPESRPFRTGDRAKPPKQFRGPGLGFAWWTVLIVLIGLTAAVRPAEPFAVDRAVSLAVWHAAHPAGLPLPYTEEATSGIIHLWRAGDVPTAMAEGVSSFNNSTVLRSGSLLAIVLGMVAAGRWRLALILMIVHTAAMAGNEVFQDARGRRRPTAELMPILRTDSQGGFPSGHTVHYTILGCFGIWWLAHAARPRGWVRGTLIALVVLLLVAVGWSRIYLGAHWVTDILAGYLWAFLWFRLGMVGLHAEQEASGYRPG